MNKTQLLEFGQRQSVGGEFLGFRIDESAISGDTNAGILAGKNHATVQKNGTGDYTITFKTACRVVPIVIGAVGITEALTDVTVAVGSVQLVFAGDTDFHASLFMPYADVEDR